MMKRRKSSINLPGSSGRQENSGLDRINVLPDSILGVILSFLSSTKNAVATSILSKRWKFAWRTVDDLNFFHFGFKEDSEEKEKKFVEFVNRVLLLNDATFVNKFTLFWKPRCILSHVTSWIRTAIAKNVHKIFLCVGNHIGPYDVPGLIDTALTSDIHEPIEMPISVFSCDSLRSLVLFGGISVCDTHAVFLPRLEFLKLVSVDFESEEAFEELISGCPMLNHLDMFMDIDSMVDNFGRRDDDFTYVISSTSLRRLEVCFRYNLEPPEDTYYSNVNLETPSVEYLKLIGYIHEIFVQNRLSSLVEADLRTTLGDDFFNHSIVEAFRAFDCAKALMLSADVMLALSFATISFPTECKRLMKFDTETYCCGCSALQDFIQNSDNLEVITIHQNSNWVNESDGHDHLMWTTPAEVPRCLSNCLKEVVITGYYGFENEREMIRLMLNHGSALEIMKISLDSLRDNPRFELLQEICKFPRKSSACEVEFFGSVPVVTSLESRSVSGSNWNDRVNAAGQLIEQPKKKLHL